jgi:hypothetical protein
MKTNILIVGILIFGISLGSMLMVTGVLGIINAIHKPKESRPVVTSEHEHKMGKHGGIITSLGADDKYHLETYIDAKGNITIFTLDANENSFWAYNQEITAFIKTNNNETSSIILSPRHYNEYMDCLYGQIPLNFEQVTIIFNINFGKDRYRVVINHDALKMPESDLSGEEERKLFLTPGGIYTEEDIKANGSTVPSVKFKGFKAKHDANPKKGDRICPVTFTLANKMCTWIVQGEEYQFCCPPCLGNFIELAKQHPEQVKHSHEYIKE